jgi:hypothetical protein
MKALEGEGRGLSHLEVVARGAVVAPVARTAAFVYIYARISQIAEIHTSSSATRVFSSAKKLLIPGRNRPTENTIERNNTFPRYFCYTGFCGATSKSGNIPGLKPSRALVSLDPEGEGGWLSHLTS